MQFWMCSDRTLKDPRRTTFPEEREHTFADISNMRIDQIK